MKKLIDIIEGVRKDKTLESKSEQLVNHYPKSNEFSPDEKNALNSYTTSSRTINGYHWQRNNKAANAYIPKKRNDVEELTNHLDLALKKTKSPHKIVVYSGTRHDPREHMNENKIVNHPAYVSTSLDKDRAQSFSEKNKTIDGENETIHQHILKIHVPKKSDGMYVEHNFGLRGEKEFILPRNTKLRHIKTETKEGVHEDYSDYKSHTHLHHMEVVNDK